MEMQSNFQHQHRPALSEQPSGAGHCLLKLDWSGQHHQSASHSPNNCLNEIIGLFFALFAILAQRALRPAYRTSLVTSHETLRARLTMVTWLS